MKDIRLTKFKDKISVFTRPKGGKYLNGIICYLELNSLDDLNKENLLKGELIELPIKENEWVGANSVYVTDNENLKVLGHIAYRDER